MKRLLSCLIMPALACGVAFAQYPSTARDKPEHLKSQPQTVKGCIQQQDGKYILMSDKFDKKHPGGFELMGSEDVQSQVGHKVRVTGTMGWMEPDGTISDTAGDSEDQEKMEKMDKKDNKKAVEGKHFKRDRVRVMNVSGLEPVSGECKIK